MNRALDAPREKESGPLKTCLADKPTSSLLFACQILRAIQSPFGWVFWLIEQRIAALDVEIERRRA
jgi:hypothetical protein